MAIFEKRVSFKPYEYPDILRYADAIKQSDWTHTEFNYSSDIDHFHSEVNPIEQSAIKRAMLAISQIEVAVKKFWGKLGDRFPKAEFDMVGFTFAESEVRHARAYSHLLEILGLNDAFELSLQTPAIQGRVEYLTKYLKGASEGSDQNFTLTLTLFSLFIENVSLFSQFAVVKSFRKSRNLFKGIDNVIQATAKEETIHAMLGAEIIRIVKAENPEWFNAEFYSKVNRACKKAYEAEAKIIDWIFEEGELDFLSKNTLMEYIKYRFNVSLQMIGAEPAFTVDADELAKLQWFEDELKTDVVVDFFNQRPVTYAKKMVSITPQDLFPKGITDRRKWFDEL